MVSLFALFCFCDAIHTFALTPPRVLLLPLATDKMAKSKNHTNHNQNKKAHKNGAGLGLRRGALPSRRRQRRRTISGNASDIINL